MMYHIYKLSFLNKTSYKGDNAMSSEKKKTSLGRKMYIFVILTVLTAAFGITAISYYINVSQIDTYFKNLALHSAENYATLVDPDFLARLRDVAMSEEYQAVRDEAEENDDEAPIEEYLKKEGLWEEYCQHREHLSNYLHNMKDLKYLYIVMWNGKDGDHDMYLLDDDENPIYETGYWELREAEFEGVDPDVNIPTTISHGDWGWLCSAYAPVYDKDGNIICHIGCDVGMEDVMRERHTNLTYMIISAILLTAAVLAFAVHFANKVVIKPLDRLTSEMKRFRPAESKSYDEAGVISLDIKSRDEIEDLYEGIRSMQINIIDHLNDLSVMQKDKEKAENEVRDKEKMIGQISQEAYRDSLTCVGNKAAYFRKAKELNTEIENGETELAVVMVDINELKKINDSYGHNAGDAYIKGCCHVICDVFKHSPVFRIGGDEFVVILRDEDYRNRIANITLLKKRFEDYYNQTGKDAWLRYSASVGMAEFASDDSNIELVFRRADKAMYEDKLAFKEKYHTSR